VSLLYSIEVLLAADIGSTELKTFDEEIAGCPHAFSLALCFLCLLFYRPFENEIHHKVLKLKNYNK
jgi:hypothetical protein